jgi:AraC family transcriptional regulator, transcriptional activator of pobA
MEHEPIPTIDLSRLNEAGQTEILVRPFGEYLLQHHKNLNFAHRHSFYHLVLFTSGAGSHTIDFTQFTLRPYQIYFMVPGQVHAWNFVGTVDGYVVNFTDSFFQSFLLKADYLESFSFFRGIAADGVLDLPVPLGEEAVGTFEKIIALYDQKAPFRLDRLRVQLLDLFMRIDQGKIVRETETIPPHHYTLLKNYQKLIEKKFLTHRRPKDYADLLAVSSNHLNALCKAYLGKQAGEVIRNRILLEAKRLLINLNQNVGEVGYALNFSDNSYFTRFFRKYTGQSPEEFRRAQGQPDADAKDR